MPIVPNNPSPTVAKANRTYWSNQNAARKPVSLPVGTVYIHGTVTTAQEYGCGVLKAEGGVAFSPVDNHPTLTGCLTRVVQIAEAPCLRLSGAGFMAANPVEWVGHPDYPIIEVEGTVNLATGQHRFYNHTFGKGKCAFHAIGGDENHAENVIVDGCVFAGIDAFHSDNQLALGWRFRDCYLIACPGAKEELVFADIRRGGDVVIDRLEILHSKVTLFKVRDYSPNNCRLICRDFHRDRCTNADHYLTILEHTGDQLAEWYLQVNGWTTHHDGPRLVEQYKVPAALSRRQWDVDVKISGEPR